MRISELRKGPAGEFLGFVALTGLLLLLPALGASNRIMYLAVVCVIWAIVAYGLFVPFALGGQMTVTTATAWGAASFAVMLASNDWGWNLTLCIPLGIVAGAIAGLVFALPVLRTSGHYFVVVTFAIASLGVIIGSNWALLSPGDAGLTVSALPELLGWHLNGRQDMMRLSCLCLTIAFVALLLMKRSRFGRRLAAIRENEHLARTVGCPVNVYKVVALTVGGAVAGLAAPLQVFFARHIEINDFNILNGITVVVILVLGGRRYVIGPVLGALFWFMGPELIGVDALAGQAIFGAALAIAIIVAPDGLVAGAGSVVRFAGRAAGLLRRPAASAPDTDDGSTGLGRPLEAPPGGSSPTNAHPEMVR